MFLVTASMRLDRIVGGSKVERKSLETNKKHSLEIRR